MKVRFIFSLIILSIFTACKSEDDCCIPNQASQKNLIIKFKFDQSQERLNNLGQPAIIPTGNATQTPAFEKMSANYIELASNATTQLGQGQIVYQGRETNAGGTTAIDFQNVQFAGNDEVFLTIPLSDIAIGTYEWIRVSLAYQEGSIRMLTNNGDDIVVSLASFIGYNTFIEDFTLPGSTMGSLMINENKLQGFWVAEALGFLMQGQAPAGGTTVPNPLFATSPIPQGSCVITGKFENPLTVTGNENLDVEVTLSFSINNSFEWTEVNADGKYEPNAGEQVVDMGVRGLIPIIN